VGVKTIEVEALTDLHNFAVVRLPDRRSPGVLVQGDSLSILVGALRSGLDMLLSGESEAGIGELSEVLETLEAAQRGYEEALAAHSIPNPY
jgi:hypothetical protein